VSIKYSMPIERIATAIPEQRLELGVSQTELARLSGVSRASIAKLEAGRRIDPRLVCDLAERLTLLELYSFSEASESEIPDDLMALFTTGAER